MALRGETHRPGGVVRRWPRWVGEFGAKGLQAVGEQVGLTLAPGNECQVTTRGTCCAQIGERRGGIREEHDPEPRDHPVEGCPAVECQQVGRLGVAPVDRCPRCALAGCGDHRLGDVDPNRFSACIECRLQQGAGSAADVEHPHPGSDPGRCQEGVGERGEGMVEHALVAHPTVGLGCPVVPAQWVSHGGEPRPRWGVQS